MLGGEPGEDTEEFLELQEKLKNPEKMTRLVKNLRIKMRLISCKTHWYACSTSFVFLPPTSLKLLALFRRVEERWHRPRSLMKRNYSSGLSEPSMASSNWWRGSASLASWQLQGLLSSLPPIYPIFHLFSIPNPLFDLAGITCGHFLVPFWTFFGATLIGKAVIKMHIQVGQYSHR